MGILSTILTTPAVGILLLALIPSNNTNQIRFTANFTALVVFLLSLWLVIDYDKLDGGIQFYEHFVFNPKLNTALALGIDGLSLPMVVLATLLTLIALLASFNIARNIKSYYVSILLLELGMLGVFLSQDWSLFYIFWELTLAPLFLLIDRWGKTSSHGKFKFRAIYDGWINFHVNQFIGDQPIYATPWRYFNVRHGYCSTKYAS